MVMGIQQHTLLLLLDGDDDVFVRSGIQLSCLGVFCSEGHALPALTT